MNKKKPTIAELMEKVDALLERVDALERVAHPQHVMADPELTEAIKRLSERLRVAPPNLPATPVAPGNPFKWGPQPFTWPNMTVC